MTDLRGSAPVWLVCQTGALTLLLVTLAGAQTIGLSAAAFTARGTYATERLTSVFVFPGVDVTMGPVRAAMTVPISRVSSELEGGTPASTTGFGLGDPLFRVDVQLLDAAVHGTRLALAAAAKPPLVDPDTGRGTGEVDAGFGATVLHTVRSVGLMADIMYWRYGDPEDVDFPDAWAYSAGLTRTVGAEWSLLGSVSGFSAAPAGGTPPVWLNLGVLHLLGRGQSVAATASIGANDSAGDFSIGLSWRVVR